MGSELSCERIGATSLKARIAFSNALMLRTCAIVATSSTIWPSSMAYSRWSARVCATSSYGAASVAATASAIIRFC